MTRRLLLALLAVALCAPAAGARELVRAGSPLALRLVSFERVPRAGEGLLAQRTIDREWGLSEDSTYRVVDVPGWKSEGLAFGLSGAVPGVGQLYDGEGSGWLYLLAESASWLGRWYERRRAQTNINDAAALLGDPTDSTASFSFAHYRQRTGTDATTLEELWNGDRYAFYRALAEDPAYLQGFRGGAPQETYARFSNLLTTHDEALQRSRLIETLLWLNHAASALDALRAARLHNLPLREEYHLEVGQHWRGGRPELRAAVVRRF